MVTYTPSDGYQYALDCRNSNIDIPWDFLDRRGYYVPKENHDLHHALILSWVEERIFPKERGDARDLLASRGLNEYDQLDVVKSTRLASRYDRFWVKFRCGDRFDEVFREITENTSSGAGLPGVLDKVYDQTTREYVKRSRYDKVSGTYGVESVMEGIAYRVGVALGICVVPYRVEWGSVSSGEPVVVCVSPDYRASLGVTGVLSAYTCLLKLGVNLKDRKSRYKGLITAYPYSRQGLDRMIVFDFLIGNYDRHLRNIELCKRGNDTVVLSPLYDNGSSLLSDWTDEDLVILKEDEDIYEENIVNAETQSKCFSHEHNMALRLVDPVNVRCLNWSLDPAVFRGIVEDYAGYLSPLRIELIIDLLVTRYTRLVRRYGK